MINKKSLLKNFSIGFLPLLIFIIGDELFGLTVGLIIAVGFGILQTAFTYFKQKVFDKFVLFDTSLIVVLGLVSLLLQNEIFFKIKPGLIGIILLILVGISAFSDNPLLVKLSGRYLKGIEFSAQQMKLMQKMLRRMFYLFFLYTLLVFYSAFFMSKEAWAFISGGMFYLVMAGLAGSEFLRALWQKRRLQKKYAREEWFDIVSTAGTIIGKAPRSAVHGNPELLHSVVHVHIVNSRGDVYLQKRVPHKDIQPGKWDTAIGGHVHSGETIDHAMRREAEEELGISLGQFQPLFRYVMRNEIESELVHGYLLREEGPFYPDRSEISEARFWSQQEIENYLGKCVFTPNFEKEFEVLQRILFRKGSGDLDHT